MLNLIANSPSPHYQAYTFECIGCDFRFTARVPTPPCETRSGDDIGRDLVFDE